MNAVDQRSTDELVLILAPTGRDARLAANTLIKAGFITHICKNVSELCQKIKAGCGAAIIAEEALKLEDIKTIRLILNDQPAWSDFPFVIFTGTGEETKERLDADECLGEIGNITLLERPVRMRTMLSAIQSVLRARQRQYEVRDLLAEIQTLNETLEKRVRERTAKLEEANRELETFAYSVSHDLRAPLRAMHSFSQMLIEEHAGQLNDEGKDYLMRILKSAKYMDSLTLDLLAYSRLSRAEFPLQKVSFEDCVNNVLCQMSEEIRTTKARITVERPLPEVLGHIAPLEQIISNLLANALKFSRENVPIQIRIYAQEQRNKVRIYIEDNGIGIAPQYHEKIFRLFERLFSGTTYPGTGIGLAIVKKGVERMGGTTGVESTSDQGSKFWVELPSPAAEVTIHHHQALK